MSTASLPAYIQPPLSRAPSYAAEPAAYEQRVALSDRVRPRPTGNFVKQSRGGGARLKLSAQEDNAELPVYGSGGSVEGTVELSKVDGVTSVEVKIEGRLKLKQIAEGGHNSVKLCLDSTLLWIKSPSSTVCPPSLTFRLNLPHTFEFEGKTYPLPPTYGVTLTGVPGFHAAIDYSVSASINKPNSVPALVPLVKSTLFGLNIGNTTVSTEFIYYPRTRPASPLPAPLRLSPRGILETPEWRVHQTVIRTKAAGGQDIFCKLYIPSSRIYCLKQSIPFFVLMESSAYSLAAYMPYGPTANLIGKRPTQMSLVRQSTVDVRNTLILGTKTDIWRVDYIGEGKFRHAGDGPTWICYSGEVVVDEGVKVTGFKAGGLTVKDCLVFSMNPPDPQKCPFRPFRLVVPIRLTTDPWMADGTGIGARAASEYSVPSTPDEHPEGAEEDPARYGQAL